jgi:membrane associated rhomboid family serine protease
MTSRSVTPLFELLALFLLVFLVQQVTRLADLTALLFVLQPPVLDNPWTIVTSVFAHGGPGHLLSNAIALVLIGLPVALYTTRARFHVFFISAGALAGVSQIVLSDLISVVPILGYSASAGVLGASGGVFGLLGYLVASNRLSASLGSVVSVPKWVTYVVFFVLAVVVTMVTASPNAALIAHFTGFLFGLLTGRLNLLAPRRAD